MAATRAGHLPVARSARRSAVVERFDLYIAGLKPDHQLDAAIASAGKSPSVIEVVEDSVDSI